MLRPFLAILQLWIGEDGASRAKHVAAVAGILAVIALSGALTTNFALAATVFLALQPVTAPAWAAAFAAAAALLLAPILIAVVYWLSKRARRHAARAIAEGNAAKAESAMLMGAIASAFVSGVVSGMDRRPTADSEDEQAAVRSPQSEIRRNRDHDHH